MSNRVLWYCINGILTHPGHTENWTTRMNSWINRHTPDGVVSDRYEYFCDIFFRNVRQRQRADEIAREVGGYRRAGYEVNLVGHSNGCALVGEVLNACGQEVNSVHLFSPAAEDEVFADCIREGLVKRIHIYGSKNDRALRWAQRLGPVAKWFPWTGRYGTLGLRGAEFAGWFPLVVADHSNDTYDHGTWFDARPVPGQFAETIFGSTMEMLMKNYLADKTSTPL